MKVMVKALLVLLVTLLVVPAFGDVGLSAKVGTLGIGADLTVGVSEKVNARCGFNAFSYEMSEVSEDDGSGGEITGNLDLQTIAFLLDWHPFSGGFRLTGGGMVNNNEISLSAEVNESVEINDHEYYVSSLDGTISFESFCPYAGIGYGNAVGKDGRFHFSFDLGVMFHGTPEVEITATASNSDLQSALNADIESEIDEIGDDLEAFTMYPVLSLGLSYRF